MSKTEPDAIPIPSSEPKVEEPVSPLTEKKAKKEKFSSDESSSSSDSEDTSTGRKYPGAANVVNITNADNVHIGNTFSYFNTLNASTHHHYTETDYSSNSSCQDDKGTMPSKELLNSTREIEPEDMYEVAENISSHWKKLARFLPPKSVFSDGQLKTFEYNNPHDQVEAIVEMLGDWKQRHPKEAAIGKLALTLWNIGRGDVAKRLTA